MEMDNHSCRIYRLQNISSLGLNTSNAIEKRGLYTDDPGVCALPGRRQSRISLSSARIVLQALASDTL
jgi:hypothetical protein